MSTLNSVEAPLSGSHQLNGGLRQAWRPLRVNKQNKQRSTPAANGTASSSERGGVWKSTFSHSFPEDVHRKLECGISVLSVEIVRTIGSRGAQGGILPPPHARAGFSTKEGFRPCRHSRKRTGFSHYQHRGHSDLAATLGLFEPLGRG